MTHDAPRITPARVILGLVAVIIAWWVVTALMISEEDRVRRTIEEISAEIEEADGVAVANHLTHDFTIDSLSAEMHAMGLRRGVMGFISRFESITVEKEIHSVTVDADSEPRQAQVTVSGTATGHRKGGAAPETLNKRRGIGGRTRFEIFLRKSDRDEWRIYRLRPMKDVDD